MEKKEEKKKKKIPLGIDQGPILFAGVIIMYGIRLRTRSPTSCEQKV